MSGLVKTTDGKHAVCVDAASRYHGWVLYRHPDGQWVTLRKATPDEMSAVEAHARKGGDGK